MKMYGNLSQGLRCPRRDSNPVPSECESKALLLRQPVRYGHERIVMIDVIMRRRSVAAACGCMLVK
jgi:hypothetical protein